MNVLFIGGSSRMMDGMIDRFQKDGHRVYVLSGRKEKETSCRSVFERYDLPCDDESVLDIMESIRPERVIFTGAYDVNFDWHHRGYQESVRYTTALIHILSAFSMTGKGRFLYLSSQEVYSGFYAEPVPETEPVSPGGHKARAVAQGEEICSNYRRNTGMDVVVLRLDGVYQMPRSGREESDPCFRMCMEAFKTGRILAGDSHVFSMLYVDDAVELSCQVMMAEEVAQTCYHISSMEEITEVLLATEIIRELGSDVELIRDTQQEGSRLILDGSRYQEEYGQKIFVSFPEGVEKVVRYLKQSAGSFPEGEDPGGGAAGRMKHGAQKLFRVLLPFAENLICFLPFCLLYSKADGSRYFERLDFFLLYVLLFAVVYGQQQAVVSALLSAAGYLFLQTGERSGFEVLLDYNTYVWTAQLFIVGMVVGYMRDRLHHVTDDKEEEIRYLRERIERISDINDSNVRMKQTFETQLINQRDSLGKIYGITSALEAYGPEEVLFHATEVLEELTGSRDVAVYLAAGRDHARLFSASSEEARRLGNTITYAEVDSMYDALKEKRVFINRDLDGKLPMMAGAVYEDEIRLIFMVWKIPWQRMTLAEANRLAVIGMLIRDAVIRAGHYLEALGERRYLDGTELLNPEAFSLLVKAFLEAEKRGLTECVLLEVLVPGRDHEQASAILSGHIRTTDYMGVLEDGRLHILLSNTKKEQAKQVVERLRQAGYESLIGKGQCL